MNNADLDDTDQGFRVGDMSLSDVVPDLRLILDETTAAVDGITVGAQIHPAFDPDAAAPGEGALLVRFTDQYGRSRVAELEISAKWLEDSCWHGRTVTVEGVNECVECGRAIDEIPVLCCTSCAAPAYSFGGHAASCAAVVKCQCEHADHEQPARSHPYLAVPAGTHRADYVGPVCDDCAQGHLADYLLNPEGNS